MTTLVRNKIEDWRCELCLSKNDIDSLNSDRTENGLVSSKKRKLLSCLLAYQKTSFPSNSHSGSKPVPVNFTPSPSKKPFMGSKKAGPWFNPIKERRNPTFRSVNAGCCGAQITPASCQHVVRTSNKLKAEDDEKAPRTLAKKYSTNEDTVSSVMAAKEVKIETAHVAPNKENVRKGMISDTILPDKELTHLHSKTEDPVKTFIMLLNLRTLMSQKQKSGTDLRFPYIDRMLLLYMLPGCKGGFKFPNTTAPGEYFGGFQARPPCRVHRKAYELSKKMPPVLQVDLLQQCHLQADILQNGCLDLFDIALYFFPADYMESSRENYNKLFELMGMENSVMISYIEDMELLIFTSKQLHGDSRDVFTRSKMDFFGGVFCRATENQMKLHDKLPSLVSYTYDDGNANTNSSEAADMDIDMIGGKILGIPNMVLSKVSAYHSINDPSAACLPLSACPSLLLNTSIKLGMQIKTKEREGENSDETREKGLGGLSHLSKANMVRLSVAGRSRGKPGAASVAGLIRDGSGRWIVGYNLNLVVCNFLAVDLCALYQGIKLTWDRGYKKVRVESDSAAAVMSLKKAPSHQNPNRALIESCRALINGEWDCEVYDIRREENLCAEWLATHADGCQLGLSVISLPPLELIPHLEDDYKRVGWIC
ncbi:hypothetical protein F3Y22_tig00002847pilonHSYRG00075 [Hibiscus syriacus]|uniref:Uncharacterized protein n=1 Tax=Hibiscus syriacus TaxID=106335 RepID=A0A6A3CPS9_HIBSY|nr:hypothetical protein F3Y22_tig00002847pilonHSYRG00075 [Hibiscus syriacus]